MDGQVPQIRCPQEDCEDFATGKFRKLLNGSLMNVPSVGNHNIYTKSKVGVPSVKGHQHFLML